MQYQIDNYHPRPGKGYTSTGGQVDRDPASDMRRWRMDDETVVYPTYELITATTTNWSASPASSHLRPKDWSTAAGRSRSSGIRSTFQRRRTTGHSSTSSTIIPASDPLSGTTTPCRSIKVGTDARGVPDIL